jgi:MFS family permease
MSTMDPEVPVGDTDVPRDGADDTSAPVTRLLASKSIRAYGVRPLVILFILNAVDEFDRAVLTIALDDIRVHFGLSDFTVGLLPLAVIFITGILALPVGNWADHYSRTKILALGALIWGSSGLFAAASRSFVQLFLTRALLGVGQGTIGPTHLSLLSDYYPQHVRGRVMNYWRSANAFGSIVGAVIGAGIVAAVGWRWGFAAAAIPGLIFGLIAFTLREPKRGQAELDDAVVDNPVLAEFLREPTDRKGFFESLGTILRTRTLRYMILANAAIGFTLIGVIVWLPALFERSYGFSTEEAGATFGVLAVAAFLGQWFAGPFADNRMHRGLNYLGRMGAVSVVILLVSWTVAFSVPFAPVSILCLVAGGFVASLTSGGLIPIVAACSSPRIRSQSFAAFGLALSVLGAAMAPLAVGGVSELFQTQGVDEGDALRYAMLLATVTVATVGAWWVYLASKTAESDAQRTIAQFLAESTHDGAPTGDPSALTNAPLPPTQPPPSFP